MEQSTVQCQRALLATDDAYFAFKELRNNSQFPVSHSVVIIFLKLSTQVKLLHAGLPDSNGKECVTKYCFVFFIGKSQKFTL